MLPSGLTLEMFPNGGREGFTTKPALCRRAVLEKDPEPLFDLFPDQLHTRGSGLVVGLVEARMVRGSGIPRIERNEIFLGHVVVRVLFGEEAAQGYGRNNSHRSTISAPLRHRCVWVATLLD